MRQYLDLMQTILNHGHQHVDRTGVGRVSIYGCTLRFNMKDGFPLCTTRKTYTDGIVGEILAFIKGIDNINDYADNKVNFWQKWSVNEQHIDEFLSNMQIDGQPIDHDSHQYTFIKRQYMDRYLGATGPIYGPNWRNAPCNNYNMFSPRVAFADIPKDKIEHYKTIYEDTDRSMDFNEFCVFHYRTTVDQLNELILNLRDRPYSSRLVISSWIPEHIPYETVSPQMNVLLGKGALAPCPTLIQCFVKPPEHDGEKPRLSLLLYQRSVDVPVGAVTNIAEYSLLLCMLAHVSGMEPDEFIWTTGDTHIYTNQIELVKEHLQREPLALPQLWLNPDIKSIYDFTHDDIRILNYQHLDRIDYPVAV